jgi:hypothetical protein
MEKDPKKPARIDLRQQQKARREQKNDEGEPVESSELTLDELEPRVTPGSIGTFF